MGHSWNARIDYKLSKLHNDKRLVTIQINRNNDDTPFRIRLNKNEDLLSSESVQLLRNYLINSKMINDEEDQLWNCLFSGKNKRMSLFIIGCDRFNGLLILNNNLYSITPLQNEKQYRLELLESKVKFKSIIDIYDKIMPLNHQNSTTNGDTVNQQQKQINLNVKIQKSIIYSQKTAQDVEKYVHNLIYNLHLTSSYFSYMHNTSLHVTNIKLIDIKTSKFDNLKKIYKQQLMEIMNESGTKQNNGINVVFVDSAIGDDSQSYTKQSGLCDRTSESTILMRSDLNQSPIYMSNVLIHTMNHNIGLVNEPDSCTQMNGDNSLWYFNRFDDELDNHCSINEVSMSCVTSSHCGNGIVETGEECDCIDKTVCDVTCCNMNTCKLNANAQCDRGGCCSQCRYRDSNTMCRPSSNSYCDIAEKCTGESAECPDDMQVHDGLACSMNNLNGVCYSGKCVNPTMQCSSIWNKQSTASDPVCYKNFNTIGFQNGNCAQSMSSESQTQSNKIQYEACAQENALCGLLSCENGSEEPLINTDAYFKSTTTLKGKQFECKMITGSNNSAIYVDDGTRCDNDKICVNRKCVQMPPNNCPVSFVNGKICSGNGICNSRSRCECFERWTGSKCDYLIEDYTQMKSQNETNNSQLLANSTIQSKSNVNSTMLFSIIAGVSCVLLFIAVVVMLFYRRRIKTHSTPTKTKIIRNIMRNSKRMSTTVTTTNDENCQFDVENDRLETGSIKFGNLPSYREYKLSKSQQQTPATNSIKSNSSGENISMTKLNHAIKQLSAKPCRGILKKPSDSNFDNNDQQQTQPTNQQHYEEIANLNDTYTNTNANRQISQIGISLYANVKRPFSALSASSSSTSSSSASSDIDENDNDWKQVDRKLPSLKQSNSSTRVSTINDIQQPATTTATHEFSKVQDYLNELNLLSKQNSFRLLNTANNHDSQSQTDLDLLEAENKKMTDMMNMLLSPQLHLGSCEQMSSSSPLVTPTRPQILSNDYNSLSVFAGVQNDMNTLNTNASETSSGYASATTATNSQNNDQKCVNTNNKCLKSSRESLGFEDDYALSANLSSADKRYSYLLATGSTNNIDIDV